MLPLSTMIGNVQDNIQDPSAQRWSTSTITQYLNDAQRDMSPFVYQLASWTTAVTAGTDFIAKPVNIINVHKVYYQDGDEQWELTRRHGPPEDPNTLTGDPDSVFFVGASLYLRPCPTDAGNVIISGTARPADLVNSTDETGLEDSEACLVAYATWRCLLSDNDPATDRWEGIYEKKRMEWAINDAGKAPQRSRIDREWF